MSFTPSNYLKHTSTTFLRDAQHASRLLVDDQFRLAPKHKFLFHVAFSINQNACKDVSLVQRHKNEINMLVKSVDLPNFSMSNELVNQYNRKKAVQIQHKVGELTITFHDDNMGLINRMWQNYYSYYYADSKAAQKNAAFSRNATKSSSFIPSTYGLDNGSNRPFFNYIIVYQMARHEYVSYKLVNPIITSWNHNKLGYSETTSNEFTMKIQCEAIAYNTGEVSSANVEGFGVEHYDNTLSPLEASDDSKNATSPSFSKTDAIINSATETLNTMVQQRNNYEKAKGKPNKGVTGASTVSTAATPAVNGIQGIAFPTTPTDNPQTVATLINLGNTQ